MKRIIRDTRGNVWLRVNRRYRMNLGDPNGMSWRDIAEGVGDAHSTVETMKGKRWKREGALL